MGTSTTSGVSPFLSLHTSPIHEPKLANGVAFNRPARRCSPIFPSCGVTAFSKEEEEESYNNDVCNDDAVEEKK
jgi:hypothetical protein